jgi:hypothetical protein
VPAACVRLPAVWPCAAIGKCRSALASRVCSSPLPESTTKQCAMLPSPLRASSPLLRISSARPQAVLSPPLLLTRRWLRREAWPRPVQHTFVLDVGHGGAALRQLRHVKHCAVLASPFGPSPAMTYGQRHEVRSFHATRRNEGLPPLIALLGTVFKVRSARSTASRNCTTHENLL